MLSRPRQEVVISTRDQFYNRRDISTIQTVKETLEEVVAQLNKLYKSLYSNSRLKLEVNANTKRNLEEKITKCIEAVVRLTQRSPTTSSILVRKITVSYRNFPIEGIVLVDVPSRLQLSQLSLPNADIILLVVCSINDGSISGIVSTLSGIGLLDRVVVIQTYLDQIGLLTYNRLSLS